MTEPRGRRPSRFIGYPTDSLLAVLPDAESAAKAAAAVKAAGVRDRDITILRGDEGAARFDPTGAVHGFIARLRRIVSFTVMDQLPDMAWYDAAIRAGQVVIMARIRGDDLKAEAPGSCARTGDISSTTTGGSPPKRSSAGRAQTRRSTACSSADRR